MNIKTAIPMPGARRTRALRSSLLVGRWPTAAGLADISCSTRCYSDVIRPSQKRDPGCVVSSGRSFWK